MTTIMLQSFTALVLGGFGSPIGAIVGGLFLGISSSLIAGYLAPSYKNTMVFTLLVVVLVFRPNGLMGQKAIVVAESGSHASFPPLPTPGSWKRRGRVIGTALGATFIAVLPALPHPFQLTSYSLVLSTAVVVISLGTFMGYVGEISLGHGALAAVGAYATAILLDKAPSVPFPAALAFAGLVAGVVGALVGWLTLRLQGLYLAIATLALTFVVTEVALQWRDQTGGATGISLPDPELLGYSISSDRGLYYLAAGTFAVVLAATAILMRSSVAQKWVAIRDAPAAAASNGVSVNTQKVLAFTVSSTIAGIGGGTTALLLTHIGPFEYDLFFSVFLILAVVIGGAGSLLGALIGSAVITLVPVAFSRSSGLTDAIFGAVLIVLMIVAPGGVRGMVSMIESARRRGGNEPEVVDREPAELTHAAG
jgi:branched-chain amino acid transport system permease protein